MQLGETIRNSVVKCSTEFKMEIPVYISVSIGCASCIPVDIITFNKFLTLADKALYAAKDAGRNCIVGANTSAIENMAA